MEQAQLATLPKKESRELPPNHSFALIMVKPHAFEQGIDISMSNLLGFVGEKNQTVIDNLKLDEETKSLLFENETFVPVTTFIRDMGGTNVNLSKNYERVIDIMYGRDKDKRHYKTLLERYKGKCAFFLMEYRGSQDEMEDALRKLKGKETFVDENSGSGVRGAYVLPKKRLNLDELGRLPEGEYRAKIGDVVDNAIHITDHAWETAEVLKLLLSEKEIENIEDRGFPIQEYINKHEKKAQ